MILKYVTSSLNWSHQPTIELQDSVHVVVPHNVLLDPFVVTARMAARLNYVSFIKEKLNLSQSLLGLLAENVSAITMCL